LAPPALYREVCRRITQRFFWPVCRGRNRVLEKSSLAILHLCFLLVACLADFTD
jgi:hypothetical protein